LFSKIRKMHVKRRATEARLGAFGEAIFAAVIELKLGWSPLGNGRLDDSGIDRQFRIHNASIDTQVRTSTIGSRNAWCFNVFKEGEKLNRKLYSQPSFFLVLIGLHCRKDEWRRYPDPSIINKTILVVNGEKVIEHLEGKQGHSMTIYVDKFKRGEYKWLKGADDFEAIFKAEYKRQAGNDMPTED